ncbi:MAG: adenosylcobinamide-GDP ribazoletransferase [Candidatus Omnitrophota bacterium]
MKYFLVAVQFLTILPVKIRSKVSEGDLGKSLSYFPLAGLVIGLLLAVVVNIFIFLPDLVKAAFVLIVSVCVTGAIHLDGFADTCDGFYASLSKEKVLEIMRDSHLGAMGMIGVVCILLLKFTLITAIPKDILWKGLIVMAVFSRWCQVLACYVSRYARVEGKARPFVRYDSKGEFLIASLLTILIFLLLMGVNGLVLFAFSLLPILLLINYIKHRIGGMTGDTIGAVSECAEAVILFFVLICSSWLCF